MSFKHKDLYKMELTGNNGMTIYCELFQTANISKNKRSEEIKTDLVLATKRLMADGKTERLHIFFDSEYNARKIGEWLIETANKVRTKTNKIGAQHGLPRASKRRNRPQRESKNSRESLEQSDSRV